MDVGRISSVRRQGRRRVIVTRGLSNQPKHLKKLVTKTRSIVVGRRNNYKLHKPFLTLKIEDIGLVESGRGDLFVAPEIQPSTQASHESQSDQQNNATDSPAPDSGSVSISSNDNKKLSREDIELVRQFDVLSCICAL